MPIRDADKRKPGCGRTQRPKAAFIGVRFSVFSQLLSRHEPPHETFTTF